jgi:hypothetical protein
MKRTSINEAIAAVKVILDRHDGGDILEALDELPALRKEVGRLRAQVEYYNPELEYEVKVEQYTKLEAEYYTLKARAETAEADLLAAQAVNAKNGAVIVEQMVELERARPLLEVAKKAVISPTGKGMPYYWRERVVGAVIKYRSALAYLEKKGAAKC